MSSKLDMQSQNILDGNIEKIATLFPNCVTETAEGLKVDFDQLRQELSGQIVEGARERYRLDWPGKREAIVTANIPTTNTLRPVREDSVDFDNTENLYIEGDNLEVLKILQESYLNKIKMIYIDPPYNTGKDFVYRDNFAADSEEFKDENLKDAEGNRLFVNPETSGRYHSDWLTMMYPRLKLARNLLTDDGVIFISIDDHEVHNLRKICDEIFGEGNFVADLIWANKEGGGSSDSRLFRIKHEHILVYSKAIDSINVLGVEISNLERYKLKDEFFNERGPYYLQKLGMGSIQYSKSLDYPIKAPDGDEIYPKDNNSGKKACWRWSRKKYDWGVESGFIEIKKDSQNIWTVYTKQYLKSDNEGNIIERTQRPIGVIDEYSSTQASKLMDSYGFSGYFNYTKPKELINYLLERIAVKNDIILDFFSGSATTAHAVMQLNKEDGGNRKFIMVQLPEATDEKSEAYKAGYKNICEIGKERIRRAAAQLSGKDKACLVFTEEDAPQPDYGFRVYRLDSSNMKDVYYKPHEFKQEQMDLFADNVKEDRTAEDLLTQIILDWGLPLSLPIERKTVAGTEVFAVAGNSLYCSFVNDKSIDEEFAKEIAKEKPLRIVFRDGGFKDDTAKENVRQLLKQLSKETEMRVV